MKSTTRREFIRGLTTVAAVAATPAVIPSCALGADGHTAASERIGLGMIGMGKMCWGHLNGMLNRQDVQVTALCDVESERLARCVNRVNEHYGERSGKADYSGCRGYRDFRDLLARPDIDAVLIATPTNWHAVMSVAALRAGKDVYCEKPFSLTIREGKAVVEAARRYQRVFQTGSQQRSDYKFRFACELVRNGCIGRIEKIHVNVGGPPGSCYLPAQPLPATLDWDLWVGPAPMRPYHELLCPMDAYSSWPRWRYYWDFGGGSMTDWGAHHFDIAQWALGMDDSGPVEIIPPEHSAENRLTYRYANGTVMVRGGASGEAGVEFLGTDGRIGVNRGYLTAVPEDLLRQRWAPADLRLYQSKDHKSNWLDCIRTRRETICPPRIGHRSVSVCHLGNIAHRLKRPLTWDPEREQFVDDALAERLLGRPLRAPWVV